MKKRMLALCLAFIVLNVADVATTLYAVNHLGADEKNPVIRWIWRKGWSYTAFKTVAVIVSVCLLSVTYYTLQNHRYFYVIFLAINLYLTYVIAKNLYLIYSAR